MALMPVEIECDKYGVYTDRYVLEELERLSAHTCDELQSRIQKVFMWLYEQKH